MSEPMTPAEWWEERYAGTDGVWSGRVNAAVADVAAELPPGSALDLGCGEGGDAVWLASRGWRVTGVDISPTAVARARGAAAAAGIPEDRVRFVAADLATWHTDERFDLVAASFLQSWPAAIPRDEILRRAARFVAPGGHLLVIAHAAAMPWTDPDIHREYRFPTPDQDLAALALDPTEWDVVLAETRTRVATAPTGDQAHDHAEVLDGVVLATRH